MSRRAQASLGGLVGAVRRRLWLQALRRELRRGLTAAAVVLGTGALLRLGIGWPGSPWVAGLAVAAVASALLPGVGRRLAGRPALAEAARAADRDAGAGELLLTAWELETIAPATTGRDRTAATLVEARAAAALPEWQRRLRRTSLPPTSGALLTPLLAAATMGLLLTATLDGPAAGTGREADHAGAAARLPAPLPATAALQAAIARIEADLTADPEPRTADAGAADAAAAYPDRPPGDAPPPRHLAASGSLAAPTPDAGGTGGRSIGTLVLSPADGAGTAPAPSAAPGGRKPTTTAPAPAFTEVTVPRRGTTPSGPGDAGSAGTAGIDTDTNATAGALPPIPRPARRTAAIDRLDPARRALVVRYHASLRNGPDPKGGGDKTGVGHH